MAIDNEIHAKITGIQEEFRENAILLGVVSTDVV